MKINPHDKGNFMHCYVLLNNFIIEEEMLTDQISRKHIYSMIQIYKVVLLIVYVAGLGEQLRDLCKKHRRRQMAYNLYKPGRKKRIRRPKVLPQNINKFYLYFTMLTLWTIMVIWVKPDTNILVEYVSTEDIDRGTKIIYSPNKSCFLSLTYRLTVYCAFGKL